MRVLILGSDGQVGKFLSQKLTGKVDLVAYNRKQLDITIEADVHKCILQLKPDVIINSAAYTAVDKAETEKEKAFKVNSDGPGYIADAASLIGAALIHISTDYVFDGKKNSEYFEDDLPSPQSVYGESKLLGEQLVIRRCKRSLVLRTSWVFSEYGSNFVKTMLRLGDRESLSVVNDQVGGPTYAGAMADKITAIVERIENGEKFEWGIYHFSGTPYVTWFEFAEEIFQQALGQNLFKYIPTITPITTKEYPAPAQRPENSKLSNEKLNKEFNVSSSSWAEALGNLSKYL